MSMEPPKFVKPVTGIQVMEGQPAHFEALVNGQPAPEVTWFREGHQIHHSEDFQVTLIFLFVKYSVLFALIEISEEALLIMQQY